MPVSAIRRKSQTVPIYGLIVDQLQKDRDLKAAVDTWKTWRGERDSGRPAARGQVTLDLFPLPGPMQWETDDSQDQTLQVDVTMTLDSMDATLLTDLWYLIQAALYLPGDKPGRLAFQKALRDAGAADPEPTFSQLDPREMAVSESGQIQAVGHILISVRVPLNV